MNRASLKNSTKIWGSLRPTTHHEFLQFTSSVDFKHLQQQIKLLKYICKSIHMYILCVYALVFTPWKIKSKAKRTRIQKVNTQKMLLEKVKDSCLMWVYCSVASCFLPNLKFQHSLVFQQDQLVFLIILIHWIIQSKLIQIFFLK